MARPIGRTKILMLASNPVDQQPLLLGKEAREIQSRLRSATFRGRFDLCTRWAVRSRDLQQALLEERPAIVHFSGHGSKAGELYLEGDDGRSHAASPSELARLFEILSRHSQFECVLLNACYSEIQAAAIARHVPYVVGMSTVISDDAAIEYSVSFYGALGEGKLLQEAHDLACLAAKISGHLEVGSKPLPPTYPSKLREFSREAIDSVIREYQIAVASGNENGGAHFGLGHLYLHLRLYDLALRHFRRTVDLEPGYADGHYYAALAMLRGRRPMTLRLQEVRDIESQVSAALQLDPRPAKYYFLLAALRFDYYDHHGLTSPSPSHGELLGMVKGKEYDVEEVERLLDSMILRDEALVSQMRRQLK